MAAKNDESVGENTLVTNILEDLDIFVGGKKRKLSESNNPERQVRTLKSANSVSSSAATENKQLKGMKYYTYIHVICLIIQWSSRINNSSDSKKILIPKGAFNINYVPLIHICRLARKFHAKCDLLCIT